MTTVALVVVAILIVAAILVAAGALDRPRRTRRTRVVERPVERPARRTVVEEHRDGV
jgi:type II secretory pathway pseudopilin PulG